jgi:hypothetical protein
VAASDETGDLLDHEMQRLKDRRRALNVKLRAAFVAGAEEHSRETVGRSLTSEELTRVLRRYPGDVGQRGTAGPLPDDGHHWTGPHKPSEGSTAQADGG